MNIKDVSFVNTMAVFLFSYLAEVIESESVAYKPLPVKGRTVREGVIISALIMKKYN